MTAARSRPGARLAGLVLAASALLAAPACAPRAPGPSPAQEEFASLAAAFEDLLSRPDHRAMAAALDNSPRFRWRYGRAWGQPTAEKALEEAFARCDEQRRLGGVRSPCRTFAVGSEVVWGRTPR